MSYGHAKPDFAVIRQLEAETRQLLESLAVVIIYVRRARPESPRWTHRMSASHSSVWTVSSGN
jgi:hypothetical protein